MNEPSHERLTRRKRVYSAPVHHDDQTNPLPETSFNKERNIHDTVFVTSNPETQHLPEHCLPNSRVHDLVQLLSLRFIIENDSTQFLAVKSAIWEQNVAPKGGYNLL